MQLLIASFPLPSACRFRSLDFLLREMSYVGVFPFGQGEEIDLIVFAGAGSSFRCLKCSSLWSPPASALGKYELSLDGCAYTMYATS